MQSLCIFDAIRLGIASHSTFLVSRLSLSPSSLGPSNVMLFSVYLTLLFVSARHVYGYVVASSIRNERYEPATATDSMPSLDLERLSLRKTRQHIRGIGAVAASLIGGDAPRLRISSRGSHDQRVTVLDVSLRRNHAIARPRYSDAEQVGLPRVTIVATG